MKKRISPIRVAKIRKERRKVLLPTFRGTLSLKVIQAALDALPRAREARRAKN